MNSKKKRFRKLKTTKLKKNEMTHEKVVDELLNQLLLTTMEV